MTWEYKIIHFATEVGDETEYEKRIHEGEHMINKLGSEGWELVGFLPRHINTEIMRCHAVFKRSLD